MQRVLVHSFVAGWLCVLLLLAAILIDVYRKETERRPLEPYPIPRAALVTLGVTLRYWPLVPLAYGLGAIIGTGVGVVRNRVDQRAERLSHRWMPDDD